MIYQSFIYIYIYGQVFLSPTAMPWKTSLVSSNMSSRGSVSVAKKDFLRDERCWEDGEPGLVTNIAIEHGHLPWIYP